VNTKIVEKIANILRIRDSSKGVEN
jgi:hypothetical protein